MKRIIGIFLFVLISTGAFAHPIKMTIGKLNFDTQSGKVYLSLNFFIDDFEPEMRRLYPQPPFDYSNPGEDMEKAFEDYIRSNIELVINDNKTILKLATIKQIESNVCQVVLKADYNKVQTLKEVSIINSLLFSSFKKQTNIVHVQINEETKTILQFYPSDAKQIVRF